MFDKHVQAYGDGPQARDLRDAADAAYDAFNAAAEYLERTYAPHAEERDGVGEERYLLAARSTLGAALDPHDAYAWAWDELHRIEDEMAAEADSISSGAGLPGAGLAEVIAHLDATQTVADHESYLAWLHREARGRARSAQRRPLRHRPAPAEPRRAGRARLLRRLGLLHRPQRGPDPPGPHLVARGRPRDVRAPGPS